MWCPKCQSDVVTELAPDNRRVLCATCGAALGESAASQTELTPRNSRTTEARQLLERWANTRTFDPFGPPKKRVPEEQLAPQTTPRTLLTPIEAASSAPHPEINATARELPATQDGPATSSARRVPPIPASPPTPEAAPASDVSQAVSLELDRITNEILSRVDKMARPSGPEAGSAIAPPARPSDWSVGAVASTASSVRDESVMPSRSTPSAVLKLEPMRPTHFSAQAATEPFAASMPEVTHRNDESHAESVTSPTNSAAPSRNVSFMGNIGQGLSYVGILGITAGLSLVILGYFGGPTHYAPTGWLIATLGQMLLLLGVVTLVSSGMEQSSKEVRTAIEERINQVTQHLEWLGQRLMRIESHHDASEVNPPHFLETRAPRSQQDSVHETH